MLYHYYVRRQFSFNVHNEDTASLTHCPRDRVVAGVHKATGRTSTSEFIFPASSGSTTQGW